MPEPEDNAPKIRLPKDRKSRVYLAFLAFVVIFGGISGGSRVGEWVMFRIWQGQTYFDRLTGRERPPISAMPGPPRDEELRYTLDASNASRMTGMNDPVQERWADVAGNFYAADLVSRFSYEDAAAAGPSVWARVEAQGNTLRGRLEARRLKPNFAYQIKLRGDFAHQRNFEIIGSLGRWRLPGKNTNYTDQEYLDFPDKDQVEAYVLFDYFVTDAKGDAVREFALDSTLHVLWNAGRQWTTPIAAHLLEVEVDASSAASYANPKPTPAFEYIWAQRERGRYPNPDYLPRLPPGDYVAALVLTEESFHAIGNDGGYWATVCRLPVKFTITP